MSRTVKILFAAAVALGLSQGANAHPHVFVYTGFVPVAEDGRLVAVETSWSFDPLYSEMVMADADTDGDGVLSEAEQAALTAVFFADLPDYDFLTRVGIDGVWHGISEADGFWVNGRDGILRAGFTLQLDLPVESTVELMSFDDEYFIAFQPDEGSVEMAGASADWQCEVRRYDLESWYFGPVVSDGLACERIGSTS